jgi:Acetyltransferase (GNAT) domain
VEIVHGYGLTGVVVDADEGIAREWAALPDIDMVRVDEPPPSRVPALVAAGFVHKPTRLTWIAATGADEAEFLARLPRKQRENVAVARRRADAEGLTIRVREPVDEALFEAFLELYERRVAQMVHGLALARRLGPGIVGSPDCFAILACLGSRLVGATICQHCPDQDLLRLRFSAVEPDQRRASLSRVMYLEALAQSRRAGRRWTSLGNDTNIYGHIVKPGLLGFKASLGFRPVPSQAVVPGDGNDEADYIVDLRAFTDPTVLLGYPPGGGTTVVDGVAWPALEAVVLSVAPHPDLHRYDIPGLAGVRRHDQPLRGSPR